MNFADLRTRMFERYGTGDCAGALALLDADGTWSPVEANHIAFWRACLLTRLGRHDAAITALQEAIDRDQWFSESQLRRDPDLAGLQGRPGFEHVAAVSLARYREAQSHHRPELRLLPPLNLTGNHPLLLILHGRSGNADAEALRWQPLTAQGWFVAAAQSSQIYAPGQFCWDDTEIAEREVAAHVDTVLSQQLCNPNRVVIAGFSQGGRLALWLACRRAVNTRGVILIAPAIFDIEAILAAAETRLLRSLGVYIIAGAQDNLIDSIRHTHRRLVDNGVACELEEIAALSHHYPSPFEPVMQRAVRYVKTPPETS